MSDVQVVQDDEDLMTAEFDKLRAARADGDSGSIEATPPTEPTPLEQSADPEPAKAEAQPAAPDINEQLKQAQAELHKARSEIGRVSALNQKYTQASQEIAQLREELAQMKQAPTKVVDTTDSAAKLAAVAEQVKDFPELAGIVAAVSDALKQTDAKAEEVARRIAAQAVEPLEPLRRDTAARAETEYKAAFDAAMTLFSSTYPTATEVVKTGDFKQWLSSQPGNIRFAFEKGQTPQEAMTVMDSYDMHLRRSGKEPIAKLNQSQAEAEQKPTPKPQDRLTRAAGIPSRASGSQGGLPPSDDFDASLAYFRAKRLNAQRLAA